MQSVQYQEQTQLGALTVKYMFKNVIKRQTTSESTNAPDQCSVVDSLLYFKDYYAVLQNVFRTVGVLLRV